MKTYDVTFQRDDHQDALKDWLLVNDVCAGERQVKHKKEKYLPKPNPDDKTERNKLRYEGFLQRAVFHNVTGRTLEGLVGTVFRKDPVLTVPSSLNYVEEDIDGCGVSIFQQAQDVVSSVLKMGRKGVYVDYPNTNRDASKAEQQAGLIRATVVTVDASKVINWRSDKYGGVHKLSLVVIEETVTEPTADGFGVETITQYRVLKLIEQVYTVEIWRQAANRAWDKVEDFIPKNGKGQVWKEIPFIFVGAKNNDTDIDKSPLLDLATLNIAHYRNSAWYEDSAYFVGQPQPWISGLTEEWRDWLESQNLLIGSSSVLPLPENGAFGYAQVAENTLVKEAMDQKEEQMKALGARVVQKGQAVKTATEAQSENESEHSVLSLVAANVSEAYTKLLGWVAEFNRVNGDVSFQLNQDFIESRLDAQMLTALVAAWQAGRLPSSDYWNYVKKHGLVDPDKTDEQLDEEVETSDNGLGVDDFEPVVD